MNADGTGIRQVTDTTRSGEPRAGLVAGGRPDRVPQQRRRRERDLHDRREQHAAGHRHGHAHEAHRQLRDPGPEPHVVARRGQIAFERGSGTNVGDTTKEIWAMDADGAGQVQRTTNIDYDVQPAWSPDGTRIAYVTNADGDLEVVSMPAGGGAAGGRHEHRGRHRTTSSRDWGVATPPPAASRPHVTDPGPVDTGERRPTAPAARRSSSSTGSSARRSAARRPKGRQGSAQEVWPNIAPRRLQRRHRLTSPDFDRMRLDKNGVSNLDSGDAARGPRRVTGLVRKVLISDIYDGTVKNLEGLGRPHYVYTYDWRRSPQAALAGSTRWWSARVRRRDRRRSCCSRTAWAGS